MNNKNKNPIFENILFIIGLIVAFNIAPPLGIFMLLGKIGVFKKRTTEKNISSPSKADIREDKYKIMCEDRGTVSIEYLASAVGVSFETAVRDIQKMVIEGKFGPEAYINYIDKTLVRTPGKVRTSGKAAAPKAAPSPKAAPAAAKASDTKKSTAKKAKSDKKSESKPYDGLIKTLLIVGIALVAIGAIQLAEPIDWLIRLGADAHTFAEMIPGALMVGGGAFSLIYRQLLKKRTARFKVYEAACTGRDFMSVKDLAAKTGVSVKKAMRDLEAMIEKGMLGGKAYIDHGEGALILKPGASPKAEPETPKDDEDRYKAIIREIRQLNDDIPDEAVSARIDEMEALTSRIFAAVSDNPEKEPQIKSFMSYYLPTTLKLLRSYAEFEKSGASGENINNAKAEIERILDTLVDGFKKQLDKLYESDAMDISSDIDVLETMLRRDGLTGDGSAFGTAAKGK